MGVVCHTGFETGDISFFDLSQNGAAVTTPIRSGTYAGRLDYDALGASTSSRAIGTMSEGYVRFGQYFAGGWNLLYGFQLRDGATTQVYLRPTNDNRMELVLRPSDTQLAIGGVAPYSVWNLIEFYWKIANSGGRGWCKINGVTAFDFTGDTQNTGNASIDRIAFGGSQNGAEWYIDDFILRDDTWAGDGRGGVMIPNAAGDHTALTRGGADSGSNYGQVDERPPNDATDYVYASVDPTYDLYGLTDLSNVGTVNCVTARIRGQKDDAGAGAVKAVYKIGSTEYRSSALPLTQSQWLTLEDKREASPATSSAWTASELASLQAGVEASS